MQGIRLIDRVRKSTPTRTSPSAIIEHDLHAEKLRDNPCPLPILDMLSNKQHSNDDLPEGPELIKIYRQVQVEGKYSAEGHKIDKIDYC